MSTFAEWKKRTKLLESAYFPDEIEKACKAAYKAGERQGRKDAETLEHELSKTLKLHLFDLEYGGD